MANTVKWASPVSSVNIMSSEMVSLATATLSAASSVVDNSSGGTSNLTLFADFTGTFTFAAAATSGGYVALYAAQAIDGTTYGDIRRESVGQLLGMFVLAASSGPQRSTLRGIQVPPYKLKFYIDNQSGATTAASSSTFLSMIDWSTYNLQIV